LHRIGVFLSQWLPVATVGSYPTLFTLASRPVFFAGRSSLTEASKHFIIKTFSVFMMTISGMVSVTLSRLFDILKNMSKRDGH